MHLIVGLGNPGQKYSLNRHNIGFMACDYWLKSLNGSDYREEHKALTKKFKIEDTEILLAKPQTYMNLSGQSVVALMNFYKIPKENLLVLHDDIDLPFGSMKIQHNRGPGGQNGVKNISELFGNNEYARLKLGVGRPAHPDFAIADYVLGNFPKEEAVLLDQFLDKACDAIESFIFEGLNKASTNFNGAVKFTEKK
ncbi:MAG: aminoacyl-tRNA hydrolase [Pseudobdellovibrio sp.]